MSAAVLAIFVAGSLGGGWGLLGAALVRETRRDNARHAEDRRRFTAACERQADALEAARALEVSQ
ncbi:MAG: hypothetical protein R2715_15045 [Ilumatobacteraceae bacterium]